MFVMTEGLYCCDDGWWQNSHLYTPFKTRKRSCTIFFFKFFQFSQSYLVRFKVKQSYMETFLHLIHLKTVMGECGPVLVHLYNQYTSRLINTY